MKFAALKDVTGKWLRESFTWLVKEQAGCCSICFATNDTHNYAVCVGWHSYDDERQPDGTLKEIWEVAWKIGRQTTNNAMQCDFDVDFEMPYDRETGDVDDTCETIVVRGGKPDGYKSWDDLAAYVRKTAKRVWDDWKEVHDDRA